MNALLLPSFVEIDKIISVGMVHDSYKAMHKLKTTWSLLLVLKYNI